MKNVKEGLCQYVVREEIQNNYFKEVEYETIRQNALDIFVEMQLRQEDNTCSLLYDVTGAQNFEESARKKEVSWQECMQLMQCLQRLMQTVEEYMLDISHVNLCKDQIYRMKDGEFRICYCPDDCYDVECDVEELFAWLLSRLNYKDHKGVSLIYHAYDLLCHQGFSQETIEKILAYGQDCQERDPYIPQEDIVWEREKAEEEILIQEKTGHKGKASWFLRLGLLASLIFCIYWGSLLIRCGFSVHLMQYMMGGGFLSMFFLFSLWETHKTE